MVFERPSVGTVEISLKGKNGADPKSGHPLFFEARGFKFQAWLKHLRIEGDLP